MTVNIKTGFEKLDQIMNCCITMEMTEGGLLEDVETFVNTYYEEGSVDEPVVWMTQHPTTATRQADISQTMELVTPFEFDCGVYDIEMEDANRLSQNLAKDKPKPSTFVKLAKAFGMDAADLEKLYYNPDKYEITHSTPISLSHDSRDIDVSVKPVMVIVVVSELVALA